jgi:hypothetical protein
VSTPPIVLTREVPQKTKELLVDLTHEMKVEEIRDILDELDRTDVRLVVNQHFANWSEGEREEMARLLEDPAQREDVLVSRNRTVEIPDDVPEVYRLVKKAYETGDPKLLLSNNLEDEEDVELLLTAYQRNSLVNDIVAHVDKTVVGDLFVDGADPAILGAENLVVRFVWLYRTYKRKAIPMFQKELEMGCADTEDNNFLFMGFERTCDEIDELTKQAKAESVGLLSSSSPFFSFLNESDLPFVDKDHLLSVWVDINLSETDLLDFEKYGKTKDCKSLFDKAKRSFSMSKEGQSLNSLTESMWDETLETTPLENTF